MSRTLYEDDYVQVTQWVGEAGSDRLRYTILVNGTNGPYEVASGEWTEVMHELIEWELALQSALGRATEAITRHHHANQGG